MYASNSAVRGLCWRKASASAGDGACVEVASAGGLVVVRDSRDRGGRRLHYPAQSWREFTARVRRSNLRRPSSGAVD
jgi:hypothetical protein